MSQHRETNPHFLRPERPHGDQTSQSTIPHMPLPPQQKTKRSKHRGSRGSQSRLSDEHVGPIPVPRQRNDQQSEPPPLPQRSDGHVGPIPVPQQRHGQQSGPSPRPERSDEHGRPIPVPVQHKDQQTEPPPKPLVPLPMHHHDKHQEPRGSSAPYPQQHPGPGPQAQHHSRSTRRHSLWLPRTQRTNFFTWFIAVFCAVFWVVIIIGGIVILIVYLVFRPRSPRFDVSSATLNAAYLDMGYLLNADLTVLANFTNPNKKMSVDFSYMTIQLYYGKTLIATQFIEPFSAAKAQTKFAYLHMVTSQVRLPILEVQRLNRQMETNGVPLEVKGFFRARSHFGSLLRYSYWLHSQCTIIVTNPPDGTLIRSKCKTKH